MNKKKRTFIYLGTFVQNEKERKQVEQIEAELQKEYANSK